MTKEEQVKAIELLEGAFYKVHNGCRYEAGKLSMIIDSSMRNKIYEFVKSVEPDTKLEKPKLPLYNTHAA